MRVETSNQDKYLAELLCEESPKMVLAREKAAEFGKTGMHLSPAEGQMLSWLVSMTAGRSVVEVGSFTGYSALWILSAMPADGKIHVLESSAEYHEVLEQTLDDPRAELLKGDARELLQTIEGKIDFIFIDANKAAYLDYLEWAMTRMNPGGLIVGDNTFLFNGVFQQPKIPVSKNQIEVMREFNARLVVDPRFHTTVIPTVEGMTVGRFLG